MTSRTPLNTDWFKSSRSTASSDNCVEVQLLGSAVCVRDSKAPEDGVLRFDSAAWSAFLSSLKP
ncbi:DUF397 domain-containing protein [Saccharopolyspora pogona]|uniref:DUF397 domain-containing protein n=1 Tax=Saccharopolyspora pogona TaxID=333966 RepID=UPI00168A1DCC|nr:DUF397 domain-containing protein [Saccharopolyspora pogona]